MELMKIIRLALLIILTFLTNSLAQQYHFKHYTTEDGLSQSSVFSIVQDDIGFMWFATEDGLNRFDGNNFFVYRPIENDSTSLPELGIRKVYKDFNGNLWVLTLRGKLALYDPIKDKFKRFYLFDKNAKPLKFISIIEDVNNVLWIISTRGDFFYYNSKKQIFIKLKLDSKILKTLSDKHIQCGISSKDKTFWLGTWEGLIQIDPVSNKINYYQHNDADKNSLGGNIVFGIAEDDQNHLWIASASGGVSIFDKSKKTFKVLLPQKKNSNSISSNRIMSLLIDKSKKIWIGTFDHGLDLYDPLNNTFTNFIHNPSVPGSFSNGAVMCIYEDNSGGIWFGNGGGALNRYDPLNQNFIHLQHKPGDNTSISSNPVLAICEDHLGNLWIGSDGGGINYKEKNSPKFIRYLQQPKFGSNAISVIYEDSKGTIWIGADPGSNSPSGTLIKYDRTINNFIPVNEVKIKIGGISAITEDEFGELWIATPSDGVHRFNPKKKTEIVYRFNPDDTTSISSNSIFSIFKDSYGNLWFGSIAAGINLFNRKTGSFKKFVNDPSDSCSLGCNSIWCITEDENKDIWIGTWGYGINKYDRSENKFVRYTIEDGLPGDIVYRILPGNSADIWMSTNKGLSRFDIKKKLFKNYNSSDGLLINDFSTGGSFKTKDGRLFFGGNSGVVVFNPKLIMENKYIPNVAITDFKVFDKSLNTENSITFTNELHLNYNQNFFTIEFASFDFTAPEKNQFEYKLEGIDENWIKAGNRHFANYTDITNGTYKFRLRGSNSSGIFNPKETVLSIIIHPPFWKTWWFRLIILSVLIILLYYAHRYRLNKLLEVERTRNKIARDLHDEVSATITGITYFSEAIDREIGDNKTPMIKKLISLIHESATDAQESMSDIIWSINPENDKWEIILPKFRRFASDICESKGINYKIEIPEVFPIKSFDMERRRNFWLVFKEMVTNAVKHSQCGNLEITIFLRDNKINLIVSDDGKGFNLEKIKKGNGVNNIYLRSKNLNGDIKLETSPEKGTKWSLSIPV